MPASPRWRHDGEVWTLARPDGATLCAYEADVGLWGWTLSRLVDGDVVTLHDSGGQWATAAEAKRAATGTATLVDARPCPLCGGSTVSPRQPTIDGERAVVLWDAVARALNLASPATRIGVARAIERAARGRPDAAVLSALAGDTGVGEDE